MKRCKYLSYSCCPQCPQYFLFNGDFYKEEEVEERIVKIKVSMRFYWGHWGHPYEALQIQTIERQNVGNNWGHYWGQKEV